jgi:hypothetical protein
MNSFISDSDRADSETRERDGWRRWLRVFCGTFFGVGALLYVATLVLDPYDTGRFPNLGIVGIDDINPRTADASRGRDLRFNASIIGDSTGQDIDPYKLDSVAGLRFLQLTIAQTGPREQLALMRWIVRTHHNYGAFVLVTDTLWCSPDSKLPLVYPFPFWLYRGDLEYLANVLSAHSLDRVGWRIRVALGLRRPMDTARFTGYMAGENLPFVPEPADPPGTLDRIGSPPGFPWISKLESFIRQLPRSVGFVIVMPPVYYKLLPVPSSTEAAGVRACKNALARAVAGRPRSGFLDFRLDSPAARNQANWIDNLHYRIALAAPMEQAIIPVLREGAQPAPAQLTLRSEPADSTRSRP